jgi:hypothetical protein
MLEARACPNCGVELSEDRIRDSLLENLRHTWAIASANKFASFDLAIIPFMAVSILVTFMEFPVSLRIANLIIYSGPVILCLKWFYRYWYRLRFTDPEYLDAVRRMKRVLALWTAANLINWIFIFAQTYYL